MLGFLKSLFTGIPQPSGPAQCITAIGSETALISDHASWDERVLNVMSPAKETIRVFEYPLEDVDQCMLGLRFHMNSHDVQAGVYPEMWVAVEGFGEAFSKGWNFRLKGTNDWIHCELPFYLRSEQRANLLKLNLVFEGPGAVSLQEIELYSTPLSS